MKIIGYVGEFLLFVSAMCFMVGCLLITLLGILWLAQNLGILIK